ncbi:MAG: class I SAM-dependent methyltransferase [Planctomycetota bacterium]|nr:class I SAM-dependent methyltransferase [Planctomycetota bacterium]
MAAAYRHRPPYAAEALALLHDTLRPDPPIALDVGAGTGDVARPLAPHLLRVDAVEPSAAMIRVGKTRPGGEAANLRWIQAPLESASLAGPYGLVVAGESIHWTNWDLAFPILAAVLAPGAPFVLLDRTASPAPWDDELRRLIGRYSTNRDYQPVSVPDLLAASGHVVWTERDSRVDEITEQRTDDYIESLHSRNGLSRARMGVSARVFDAQVRDLLTRHGADESVGGKQTVATCVGRVTAT